MAENKLFYNVSERNAKAFKELKEGEKVLGLVHPENDDDFGYIISQGKQFGASKADINSMIDSKIITPSGSGSFTADGVEYSVSINASGVLAVNKYIKPIIHSISFTGNPTSSITNSGQTVEYFIGESYNIAYNITSPTSGTAKVTVYNPTNASFEVTVGSTTIQSSSFTLPDANAYSYYNINWTDFPNNISGNVTGTVNYAGDNTITKSTSKEITFTIEDPNKADTTSTKKQSINYSVKTTVSAKYVYYLGETLLTGDAITSTSTGWNVQPKYNTRPSSLTVPAGKTYYFIVPTAIGTPKFDNAGFGVTPEETSITVNKIDGKTLSGSKTYKAYKVVATSGDVTLNIKW